VNEERCRKNNGKFGRKGDYLFKERMGKWVKEIWENGKIGLTGLF